MNAPTSSIPGLACHLRDRAISLVLLEQPDVCSLTLSAALDVDGAGSVEVRTTREDGHSHTRTVQMDARTPGFDARVCDLIESAAHSAPCAGRIETDQCVLMV